MSRLPVYKCQLCTLLCACNYQVVNTISVGIHYIEVIAMCHGVSPNCVQKQYALHKNIVSGKEKVQTEASIKLQTGKIGRAFSDSVFES